MRIGLLECDHVGAGLRHFAGDYRAMLEAMLNRVSPDLELESYDVINGELPASVDECDAYIATGSRFSAYDDEAWIRDLKSLVRSLADTKRRFAGICFGHQILAEALGGKVTRSSAGWGIGIHQMKLIRSEPWMRPPLETCALLYSNRDHVEQLPENGVLLGSTPHCPIAMFRAGSTMIGIQGHPEFPPAYAQALAEGRVNLIGREAVESAVFDGPVNNAEVASWIANFLMSDS